MVNVNSTEVWRRKHCDILKYLRGMRSIVSVGGQQAGFVDGHETTVLTGLCIR